MKQQMVIKQQVTNLVNVELYQVASAFLGMPYNHLPFVFLEKELDIDFTEITYEDLLERYENPAELPDPDLRALALAGLNSGHYFEEFELALLKRVMISEDAVFELYCYNCCGNTEVRKRLHDSLYYTKRKTLFAYAVVLFGVYEQDLTMCAEERMFVMCALVKSMEHLIREDAGVLFSSLREMVYAAEITKTFRNNLSIPMKGLFVFTEIFKKANSFPARWVSSIGIPYETALLFSVYCASIRNCCGVEGFVNGSDAERECLRQKMGSPYLWSDSTKMWLLTYRSSECMPIANYENYDWMYETYGLRAARFLLIDLGQSDAYEHLLGLDDQSFVIALRNSLEFQARSAGFTKCILDRIHDRIVPRVEAMICEHRVGSVQAAEMYCYLKNAGLTVCISGSAMMQVVISHEYLSHDDWIIQDVDSGALDGVCMRALAYELVSRRCSISENVAKSLLTRISNPGLARLIIDRCDFLGKCADEKLLQIVNAVEEKTKACVDSEITPLLYDVKEKELSELQRLPERRVLLVARYGKEVNEMDLSYSVVDMLDRIEAVYGLPYCQDPLHVFTQIIQMGRCVCYDNAGFVHCMLKYGVVNKETYLYFFDVLDGTFEEWEELHSILEGNWLPDAGIESVTDLYKADKESIQLTAGLRSFLDKSEKNALRKAEKEMAPEVYASMLQCWKWTGFSLRVKKLVSVWPGVCTSECSFLAAWLCCNGYTKLGRAVKGKGKLLSDFEFISHHVNWDGVGVDAVMHISACVYNKDVVYSKESLGELSGVSACVEFLEMEYPGLTKLEDWQAVQWDESKLEAVRYNLGRYPLEWYQEKGRHVSTVLVTKFNWDEDSIEFADYVCGNRIYSLDPRSHIILSIALERQLATIADIEEKNPGLILKVWQNVFRFVSTSKTVYFCTDEYNEAYKGLLFHELTGSLEGKIFEMSSKNCQKDVFYEWYRLWDKSCGENRSVFWSVGGSDFFSWLDVYVGGCPEKRVYLLPVDGELSIVAQNAEYFDERVQEFSVQFGLKKFCVDTLGRKSVIHVYPSLAGKSTVLGCKIFGEADLSVRLEEVA